MNHPSSFNLSSFHSLLPQPALGSRPRCRHLILMLPQPALDRSQGADTFLHSSHSLLLASPRCRHLPPTCLTCISHALICILMCHLITRALISSPRRPCSFLRQGSLCSFSFSKTELSTLKHLELLHENYQSPHAPLLHPYLSRPTC